MTAIRQLVLALVLAALTATSPVHGHARVNLADPFYCVTVRDGNGNPIETVCVPAPVPPVAATDRSAGV